MVLLELGGLWFFFFSSRRRHTRWNCDWSSDVCSSDLILLRSTKLLCASQGRNRDPARAGFFMPRIGPSPLSPAKRAKRPCARNVLVSTRHIDRKSTRLNSSHSSISYAVFCLKKKKKTQ